MFTVLASRLHSISFEAAVSKYLRNDDNHNNNKTFNQPIPIRMRQFKLLGQYGGREYTDLYMSRGLGDVYKRQVCVCVCVCPSLHRRSLETATRQAVFLIQ